MPNIRTTDLEDEGRFSRAQLGALAGAEHLGLTVYELEPGQGMHFHYHPQREEILVVLDGKVAVRTAGGWEEAAQGEVVAFARGERGAHAYENRSDAPVRLLMISEQTAPNVTVYPDTNQIGIYDVGPPGGRRVGGVFDLADSETD
jgi:uncharacterized cupin superfamily protein